MSARMYSEEEVEQLKQAWESDLFEQKTNDTLRLVVKRLDESNGYKNTFGKDLVEIKQEVKEVKSRVIALEDARKQSEREVKDQLQARQDEEDKRYKWFQDRWIRAGIAAGILWEAWTIFGEPVKVALHHLGWG